MQYRKNHPTNQYTKETKELQDIKMDSKSKTYANIIKSGKSLWLCFFFLVKTNNLIRF